jgi:RNA-directed DNA polymerase
MTETDSTDTSQQREGLLEQILSRDNLNRAYKQVKRNKGAGGIDGMQVDELLPYLREHKDELIQSLRDGKYRPQPVRRVEIPKENGKTRKLGIPTVVDRLIQQAICQVLSPIFEKQFSDNSFGFRPKRSAHDALKGCQTKITEGYRWVVDIDLERYFDTVNQSKLIQLLSETIKDGRVISLIHKFLRAGVMVGGMFEDSPEGVPQGGPLSPLLGNIMLNECDHELERRGHRFVRYADDLLIFCKSRKAATRTLNHILPYIERVRFLHP